MIAKQKDISNEYKLLTQMFEEDIEQRAEKLLESIDLAELQNLL